MKGFSKHSSVIFSHATETNKSVLFEKAEILFLRRKKIPQIQSISESSHLLPTLFINRFRHDFASFSLNENFPIESWIFLNPRTENSACSSWSINISGSHFWVYKKQGWIGENTLVTSDVENKSLINQSTEGRQSASQWTNQKSTNGIGPATLWALLLINITNSLTYIRAAANILCRWIFLAKNLSLHFGKPLKFANNSGNLLPWSKLPTIDALQFCSIETVFSAMQDW